MQHSGFRLRCCGSCLGLGLGSKNMALDLGFGFGSLWLCSCCCCLRSLVVWAWGSGLECREYRRGVYFACDFGVTVGQKPETGQDRIRTYCCGTTLPLSYMRRPYTRNFALLDSGPVLFALSGSSAQVRRCLKRHSNATPPRP